MAVASQGVTTRSQAKKLKEGIARQVTIAKRKSSTREAFMSVDEENLWLDGSACGHGPSWRKSFPPENGSDSWTKGSKKVAKTDMSSRQKRALCERGRNNYGIESSTRDSMSTTKTEEICLDAAPPPPPPPQDGQRDSLQGMSDDVFIAPTEKNVWRETDISEVTVPPSPMECAAPYVPTVTVPSVPVFITDIDCNSDNLRTSVYSKCIMEYLYNLEGEFLLNADFLDKSPEVTSRMRGVLMDWLLQVQNHEDLTEETLHLCISFIDQYLSVQEVAMPQLQLLGITCLLVAAKFCERFAPDISVLCYLTANTFEKEEVIRYERIVLQVLQFRIARPVCTFFLDRFFQVQQHSREVEILAKYLLDLSITQVSLVPVPPSLKAASALYLARRLLASEYEHPWTPDLVYYTHYTTKDLKEAVSELATLLIKAPDSKFQGARNKYNSQECLFISHIQQVSPAWVLYKHFGKVMKQPPQQ